MSTKKKKALAQASNPVGYGRPPVHSRFRKGQSGNPTGKRRHGEAERVEALIRQEVYRLLTVREGDKVTKMPALQAVIRSQIASATKGNVTAQRALLKLVQNNEDARARTTGQTANMKLHRDVNEMSDKELMNILRAARNDKS
jgi:DNA-binding transcriptional regulator YdaS (Cro superfamily)